MKWEAMEKKVKKYITEQKLLVAGDHVLIGVSGGADSLALLYFLEKYAKEFEITLGVGHLHHDLRGKIADEDEAFVRDFCFRRGVPFYSRKRDIKNLAISQKISIEEAGRNERHGFLRFIAKKEKYNRIAMGHHINDQAETMLMRLIRGTGIKGVSGIKSDRDHGIIRPFLCLEKREILSYCKEHCLEYRTDSTNFQKDYTRNKIRLDILPMISEINPKAEIHFNEFTKIALEYEDFFETYINKIEEKMLVYKNEKIFLNHELWNLEKPIVQKELLRRGIYKFKGSLKEIEYNHITAFFNLLKSGKTLWEFHLPNDIRVSRRYDFVTIEKNEKTEMPLVSANEIILNKTWILSKERVMIRTEIIDNHGRNSEKNFFSLKLQNHSEKYFDYDKIDKALFFRSRQSGDYFYPVGVNGKKTIKKYFIDKKVNRDFRESIPLIAMGSEILWIIGYGINERLLVKPETQKILKIQVTLC